MKGKLQLLIALLALVMLLMLQASIKAQDATPPKDPEAVYRAAYAAQNAGDVEASMALFAENAVSIALPPPPGTNGVFIGKAAIREVTAEFVTRHPQIEFVDFQVNGDTLSFTLLLVEDVFREIGVFPIKFSGVAVVQDGLIQSDTWIMDKDSLARLDAAITLQANKAATRRNYEELWSQGNLAVADEITDPEVLDHHSGETGTEGLKQIITLMRQAFPDLKVTINHLVAEGDLVVADVTFDEGVYKGGLQAIFGIPDSAIGKSVKIQAIDVYRFKDGKIVEAWGLSDQMNWYKQLGVELATPDAK